MANLAVTAAKVAPASIIEQATGPSGAALAPGDVVRLDTATGRFVKADATTANNAKAYGICITTAKAAGQTVTVVRKGLLNIGDVMTALAFEAQVFLSDTSATLADAAGTSSKVIGTVVPAWGATAVDKLLRIDL